MSCDQNGHFMVKDCEVEHVKPLVEAGLMFRKGEISAHLTPLGESLLHARGRHQGQEHAH